MPTPQPSGRSNKHLRRGMARTELLITAHPHHPSPGFPHRGKWHHHPPAPWASASPLLSPDLSVHSAPSAGPHDSTPKTSCACPLLSVSAANPPSESSPSLTRMAASDLLTGPCPLAWSPSLTWQPKRTCKNVSRLTSSSYRDPVMVSHRIRCDPDRSPPPLFPPSLSDRISVLSVDCAPSRGPVVMF